MIHIWGNIGIRKKYQNKVKLLTNEQLQKAKQLSM